MLPKLLAKENVTIRHGNFSTAWFDIKNRVLGLPIWKDMNKNEYDLFTGHEVGHALYTPYEGWHDNPEVMKGCPKSYINVIEDARIERLIQNNYPGLVNSFTKGYQNLVKRDFFGDITDIDYSEIKLIDKINLKTKLRALINVPFSTEEKVFLDRSLTTETFEEVIQLVKDVLAFTKENTPELIQKPEPQTQPDESDSDSQSQTQSDPTPNGHDDYEDDEEDTPKEKEELAEKIEAVINDTDLTEDDKNVKLEELVAEATRTPEHGDEDMSLTDEMFRAMEETLIDQNEDGHQPIVISEVNKKIIDLSVIPYKQLAAGRKYKKEVNESYYGEVCAQFDSTYKSYMKTTKKNVQFAIREFEMKKAAHQTQRATESTTGSINPNKLWSYKLNDDIFLRSTQLPNAKSHGMLMLIDYSGSMSSSMRFVMDQVLHTIMFCKGVNIPFEVYGFTSQNDKTCSYSGTDEVKSLYHEGHLDMDNLSMPLLVSSSMSKSDFEEATKYLYYRVCSSYYDSFPMAKEEQWGSTPLNQALIISHTLIKKFKAKHNIEKMNFITFTDGDANPMYGMGSKYTRGLNNELRIQVDGKMISTDKGARNITESLLKNIKTRYDTSNIAFFMADSSGDWKYRLNDIQYRQTRKDYRNYDEFHKNCRKEYNRNKCVGFSNIYGYDEYYMVKGGRALSAQDEDFEVDTDASKGQIGTAFKKFARAKKTNKVLMTKFGAAVA